MLVKYLEILEGSEVKARFRIREGLRIGRTTGEVLLDDPKVSALHARVETDGRGRMVLVDQNSNNGLRINSNRVKRVAMMHGVVFQVGRTFLKVSEEFDTNASPEDPPATPAKTLQWKELLLKELRQHPGQNPTTGPSVDAFRPALQLDFLEGVQIDQQILLGYGPRRFGADVLDIELQEPMCPPVAFEVTSQNGEAVFQTQYPKLVLLNEASTTGSVLHEGDRIRIGQTLIHVSFVV